MNAIVPALAFITFLSTLAGGVLSIRIRKYLPYLFAWASGGLIAVSFFDIFPESLGIALKLNMPVRYLMVAIVASYLFYNFLERFFLTHHYHRGGREERSHLIGPVGATGLTIHSFLDGVAIGAAYQVSAGLGIIVALAVIFHDFDDGVNTVTLVFRSRREVRLAGAFLFFDALAPVLGVLSTYFVSIPEAYLAIMLAIFTGEFVYLGASSILRETFQHEYWRMMLPMAAAVLLIFVLTSLI